MLLAMGHELLYTPSVRTVEVDSLKVACARLSAALGCTEILARCTC